SFHQEKFEPRLDREALEQLARWCEQFSPAVGLEDPDCLWMDVTGLAALFGSEQRLMGQMLRAFHQRGLEVRVAITDTYAAAWALAHYAAHPAVVIPAGEVEVALARLPIAALKLPDGLVGTMAELGIAEIGQLLQLPRDSIAARFDVVLLSRLDQAIGKLTES